MSTFLLWSKAQREEKKAAEAFVSKNIDKGHAVLAFIHLLAQPALRVLSSPAHFVYLNRLQMLFSFSSSSKWLEELSAVGTYCGLTTYLRIMKPYVRSRSLTEPLSTATDSFLQQHHDATKWAAFEQLNALWTGKSIWRVSSASSFKELQIYSAFLDLVWS